MTCEWLVCFWMSQDFDDDLLKYRKVWCWGFIFYADSQAFDPGIMAWKAIRWIAALSRLVYHCSWHFSSRFWGMARDHRGLQCFGRWRHPWQTCYFWLRGAYQGNEQVFRAHVWSDVFLLEDEGGHECWRISRLQEAGNGFAAAVCFILSKSASQSKSSRFWWVWVSCKLLINGKLFLLHEQQVPCVHNNLTGQNMQWRFLQLCFDPFTNSDWHFLQLPFCVRKKQTMMFVHCFLHMALQK